MFGRCSKMEERKGRVSYVIGPDGSPLTLADLPPPSTRRWVIRRKAEVVAAVRGGLLSLDDACKRYTLTGEEFLDRQRITLTGIIQAEKPTAHGGDDLGLAPDNPAARGRRRQIGERQRTSIRSDDIAHAPFALFHLVQLPIPLPRQR